MGAALWCLIATGPVAKGDPLNKDLAADGTEQPYSTLNDAIPTQWSLLLRPTYLNRTIGLTPDVSATWSDLAEPGLGTRGRTLGQIVNVPARADRSVYAVYDRLSGIDLPIFLYYHWGQLPNFGVRPFDNAQARRFDVGAGGPVRGGGGSGGGGAAAGSSTLGGPGDDPLNPIPEPATLLLLCAGAAIMAGRRGRRRCGSAQPPVAASASARSTVMTLSLRPGW